MQVSTDELTFKGTFRAPTTTTLTLTNPTSSPLGYKIKTNAAKVYSVKPNFGSIGPNGSATISITLPALKQSLPKNYKSKHKFLVVTLPSDGGDVESNWKELETKHSSQITMNKIKVNYIDENVDNSAPKLNGRSQRISKFAPNGAAASGSSATVSGAIEAVNNAGSNTSKALAGGVAAGATAVGIAAAHHHSGHHNGNHKGNHPYSPPAELEREQRSPGIPATPSREFSSGAPSSSPFVGRDIAKELDSLVGQVERSAKKLDNIEKLLILALMLLSFILGKSVV